MGEERTGSEPDRKGQETRGGTLRARRLVASIAFCALVVVLLAGANVVMKPARKGNAAGSQWHSYLGLKPDSVDVVFFGTSHVFSGIDPATVWRTSGIPSYVLAGSTQELQLTEYYVREALLTQKPKVIVLEMSSAAYGPEQRNPAFQRINVAYMPWGRNRVEATCKVIRPGDRLDVLLDFWPIHARPTAITLADFRLEKDGGYEYLKGFKPRLRSEPVTSTPYVLTDAARREADREVAYNLPALRRIMRVAKENGVKVLLLLTPTSPPGGYGYHLRRVESALASEFPGTAVLDLDAPGALPTLSYASEFEDVGHLSYTGAEKASAAIATFLAREYALPDRRNEPAYASWTRDATSRDGYIERRLPKGD